MRTLGRILLGGATVALLLSVTAAGAMAQEWGEEDWVVFTGESTYACGSNGVCQFTDTMSDPRVSGDGDVRIELGCSPRTTCSMGGEVSITNDAGAWQGHWIGFIEEGLGHDLMGWMEGTGDYEGWSYIARYIDVDGDQRYEDVKGLIYRGELPSSVASGLVALAD